MKILEILPGDSHDDSSAPTHYLIEAGVCGALNNTSREESKKKQELQLPLRSRRTPALGSLFGHFQENTEKNRKLETYENFENPAWR